MFSFKCSKILFKTQGLISRPTESISRRAREFYMFIKPQMILTIKQVWVTLLMGIKRRVKKFWRWDKCSSYTFTLMRSLYFLMTLELLMLNNNGKICDLKTSLLRLCSFLPVIFHWEPRGGKSESVIIS